MHTLGAKIIGYAIDPISKPNFFDDMKLSRFLQKDYRKNINDIKYLKKLLRLINRNNFSYGCTIKCFSKLY